MIVEYLISKYGPLMDIDDLAELLKVSKQTVYKNLKHDMYQFSHIQLGQRYLFNTFEVASFIDGQDSTKEQLCGVQ